MVGTFVLAAVLSLQGKGVPNGWVGVWATSTGFTVAITSREIASFVHGERHYDVTGLYRVPDGFYLGQHAGARYLRYQRSNLDTADPRETGAHDEDGRHFYAFTDRSDNRDTAGETTIKPGPPDPYGVVRMLTMVVTRARGERQLSATLTPLIRLSDVRLGGRFADGPVNVSFSDNPRGEIGVLEGTFSYNGGRLLVQGERRGVRGAFSLINPSTGREAGFGYAEWTPTPDAVAKIRSSQDGRTDQLALWFTVQGMASRTGMQRTLRRQD